MNWVLCLLGFLALSHAQPKSFVYVSEVEEDILPPALRLSRQKQAQQRYNPPQIKHTITQGENQKILPLAPVLPTSGNAANSGSTLPRTSSSFSKPASSGNNARLPTRTSSPALKNDDPSSYSGNSSPTIGRFNSPYPSNPSVHRNSDNSPFNTQDTFGSSRPFNASLSSKIDNNPSSFSGSNSNNPSSSGRRYPSSTISGNNYPSRSSGDNFLDQTAPKVVDNFGSSRANNDNPFTPPRSYSKIQISSPGSGFSNNLGNVNRTSPRQLTSRNVNPSSYNTQGLTPQKDGYSNYSPSIPSQLSLQKASVSEENSQRKKGKALTPCELLRDQISLNLPLATFRFANENQQTGGYTGDASSGDRNPSFGFNDNPGRRGRNTSGRDGNIGVSRQTNYSPVNSFPSGRSGRPQSQTYVQLPHKNSNVPVLVGYQYNRSPADLPSQTQRNKQNFNTVPPNLNRFSFDNPQQNRARFSNAGNVARSSNPLQNSGQSIDSENTPQNQNKQASVVQNNYPNSDNEQRSNYSPQPSSSVSQSGGNSQDFRSGNRNKNVKLPRIYFNNDHSGRTGSNTGLSINNSGRSRSSYTYYRPTSTPNHPTEPVEKATFGTAYITIAPLPLDVDGDEIPGRAGVDYPTYHAIPTTSFTCNQVPFNGYYADMEASCQVVHFCQSGGVQNSFLCPNGTIFSQKKFSCQWWYKTNCTESPFYFSLNSDLYKIPSKKLN